jgi:hypothetical protein
MFDRPGGNPAARFICVTDEKSHAAEPRGPLNKALLLLEDGTVIGSSPKDKPA